MRSVSPLSRRKFLRTGAAAGMVVLVRPALGGAPRVAPSNRITVGSIGLGGMGNANLGGFINRNEIQVVAVCDVDAAHREAARERVERHYAAQTRSGVYRGCAAYNDFRELLARPDIDVVVIATPDHWHVPIAVAAARAGKDMYCEKPLTLTVHEGRVLSDTVRRHGRVLQVGSQQRSSRRFRFACELVRNGRIGRVLKVETRIGGAPSCGIEPPMPVPEGFDYDFWLGQAPEAPYTRLRCHGSFRWLFDYSGGKMTDWGAHHNDIAQWALGTERSGPVEVDGVGVFPEEGLFNVPIRFDATYRYADGVVLTCTSRGENGVFFQGTDGWVFVSRSRIDAHPKSLLKETIGTNEIHLYDSRDHRGNFLECVRTRAEPIAPPEIGHRSATVCHIGNISMLLGRKLRWDPHKEIFPDDAAANRMLRRAMRSPWRI
ncbi:MAG: Gfo/Idh/MocA family oxidoreductase [Kiritimatiellaeota bacterium]|nr:Gfo/Idh/MocA family oxidoreductase [Kiritimatiellota bacterium]